MIPVESTGSCFGIRAGRASAINHEVILTRRSWKQILLWDPVRPSWSLPVCRSRSDVGWLRVPRQVWRWYWSCVPCEPDPAYVLALHEWTQAVMLHQQTWKGTRDDLQAGTVSKSSAARPSLGTRQAWRSSEPFRRVWWQSSCSRSVLPWLLVERPVVHHRWPQKTTYHPTW